LLKHRIPSDFFEIQLLVAIGNTMVKVADNMGLPQLLQSVMNGLYNISEILLGLDKDKFTYFL